MIRYAKISFACLVAHAYGCLTLISKPYVSTDRKEGEGRAKSADDAAGGETCRPGQRTSRAVRDIPQGECLALIAR